MDSSVIRQGPCGPATDNRDSQLPDKIVSKIRDLEAEHVIQAKTLIAIEEAMKSE